MAAEYRVRFGTVHGSMHRNLNINNQDAVLYLEFGMLNSKTIYRVGLVSDGCTGIPAFTRSEVGSNLLVVFCLAHIQELLMGGTKVEEIPVPLYHLVKDFIRNLSNMAVPAGTYWPYSIEFRGSNQFRNGLTAPQRFTVDYMAATLLGFVDDGTTLVTFRAGDGVIIVNDDITVIDQNDRPDYPALSSSGFDTQIFASAEVGRLALATDGIRKLLGAAELGISEAIFADAAQNPLGLQILLNRLRKQRGELIYDDCTIVTRERIEGGAE